MKPFEEHEQRRAEAFLRSLLAEKKWTKAKLAEESGVLPADVSRYTNGTVAMSAGMFVHLAKQLGADPLHKPAPPAPAPGEQHPSPELQKWLDHPDVKLMKSTGLLRSLERHAMFALDRAGVFKGKKHDQIQHWFREILFAQGRAER